MDKHPIAWELSCFMQQTLVGLDTRTSEVLGFSNGLVWAQILPLLVLLVYPQVNIRFADSVRKPGEPTRLIITAAAGSQVAVTAVDKSVHLLKGGNELTEDDVRAGFIKCMYKNLICQLRRCKCVLYVLVSSFSQQGQLLPKKNFKEPTRSKTE